MKITLLVDSLGFGGAQRQMVNLAVALKDEGHEITFLRYRDDNFYLPILEKSGIPLVLASHSNLFVRAWKIVRAIRKSKAQVVISFMDMPNVYASLASVWPHSWRLLIGERTCNPDSFTNRRGKLFKRFTKHYADAIVCNSQSAAELWRKHYPDVAKKLHTVYNIIEFPESEAKKEADGKTRLVVAARYEKEKNLFGVIEAVASLCAEEKEKLELHWFGKANVGTVLTEAKPLIKRYGLESCVYLHPATDRIHDEMAKADFVALFSFVEGLPNAVLEGMALKKPIVMSKVSDYAALVNEENGFLCDPKSKEDMAEAIRSALSSSEAQRKCMGEKSYKKLLTLCSKDAIVSQWNQLIEPKSGD